MPLQLFLFAGLIALFPACHSTKNVADAAFEKFIQSQLPGAELIYNSTKDFVLCLSKSSEPATGRKAYLVVEVATHKTITEGSFMPGYLKWLNNDELELFDAPGMINKQEDNAFNKKIIRIRSTKS
jgi:hypothetical protein